MNAKLFLCLFFVFYSLSAFAQDPYSDAIKAYQEKNYKAYLDNIVIVRSLLKAHTGIIEMTARAYALNNKTDDALRELNLIADMGGSANLDNPDYASIKEHKELQVISEKFAANNKPVVISSKAFTLPDKEFIPEGLAFNPNDNSFYVGSITKGVIRKILPDGSSKEVIKLKAPAPLSVTGMKVDAENNVLWVCAFAGSAADNKKGASAI